MEAERKQFGNTGGLQRRGTGGDTDGDMELEAPWVHLGLILGRVFGTPLEGSAGHWETGSGTEANRHGWAS